MKSLTLAALGLIAGYAVAEAGTSAQTPPATDRPSAALDQSKCDSVWKVAAPSGETLTKDKAVPFVINFQMVDTDNDGSISQSEFKTGCDKGWIKADSATATDMTTEAQTATEATPPSSSPATDETKTESEVEPTPQASTPPSDQTIADTPPTRADQTFATVPNEALLVSDYYDQNVYDPQDNKIGKVQDILIAKDGKLIGVMLGVGGFLGIGEKNVAVPFDSLKVVEKNNRKYLAMDATKESLESAPGYTWDMTDKKWVPAKS